MKAYKQRDIVLKEPEYYNIKHQNMFVSLAYFKVPELTLGRLFTYWERSMFIDPEGCCGPVYEYIIGGSPLSGSNGYTGICSKCGKEVGKSNPGDSWRDKWTMHMNFKPIYSQSIEGVGFRDLIEYINSI